MSDPKSKTGEEDKKTLTKLYYPRTFSGHLELGLILFMQDLRQRRDMCSSRNEPARIICCLRGKCDP